MRTLSRDRPLSAASSSPFWTGAKAIYEWSTQCVILILKLILILWYSVWYSFQHLPVTRLLVLRTLRVHCFTSIAFACLSVCYLWSTFEFVTLKSPLLVDIVELQFLKPERPFMRGRWVWIWTVFAEDGPQTCKQARKYCLPMMKQHWNYHTNLPTSIWMCASRFQFSGLLWTDSCSSIDRSF